MKNRQLFLFCLSCVGFIAILFSACRKINESTELGADLVPPIDNINTFEVFLPIQTDNQLFNDTNRVYYDDDLAVGSIASDPEFGATQANAFFNLSATAYGVYPFPPRDSIPVLDSVVLSLSYEGAYGDTLSSQTLRVFEIAQAATFNDTTGFRYNHPDIQTVGSELGSKTFQVSKLKDSVGFYRKSGDTTKFANVIRIKLNTGAGVSLGNRLIGYDTSSNPLNGAYFNDTAFKKLFKGLAIKADAGGRVLTYFKPADATKTKLIVYYTVKKGTGLRDTLSTEFYHTTGGQANLITRTPQFGYQTYLNAPGINDDKIYLQSAPGSFASLVIPGLGTFENAIIHRAEIIVKPLPSASQNIFLQPAGLFLDRVNPTNDTAFTFDTDQTISVGSGFFSYDATLFGGLLKSDSSYRFNISRYVQNMVTTRAPNYKLRLYAPVRAFLFSKTVGVFSQIYVNARPADGRVVLAGGSFADETKRMRLRIVYSKL